jgi:rhodanese-related sulfurtransferase
MKSECIVVDVRSPSEFATGHLAGSLNIPMDQIESRLADIPPEEPVLLVCQSGKRAGICAGLLASRGYNVRVLEGGLRNASGTLVVSSVTGWSLERQVRFGAGLLVLASLLLAYAVDAYWLGLTAFVGAGLTFAGATDICLMGSVLARMPWNRLSGR